MRRTKHEPFKAAVKRGKVATFLSARSRPKTVQSTAGSPILKESRLNDVYERNKRRERELFSRDVGSSVKCMLW